MSLTLASLLLLVLTGASSQKKSVQDEVFSFGEDQAANTRIGTSNMYETLMKVEKLRNQFAGVDKRSLRFEILKNEPMARYFRIDNTTSELFLVEQVDRDALCGSHQQCCQDEKNCIMNLMISVRQANNNNQERELLTLRIEVQDKDDNSPVFERESYTVEIREDATVNTRFALLAARDRDTTANGIARYSLRNETNTFGLVVQSLNSLFLSLLRPLDREVQDRYSFVLVADGRNSQRTGEMRIEIVVRDANDHFPVFFNRSYGITVPEDLQMHAEILRVEALDRDDGENGRIIYDLDLANDNQKTLFEIDPDTGSIYLKAPLDYERESVHVLRVQARDGGNHPTIAETIVTINVTDVNDCAPEIQLEAYDDTVEVVEGRERPLPLGLTFAIVRDLDKTNSTNGNFTCALNDTRFRLLNYAETRTLFRLNLTEPLDRERSAVEYVSITCTDRGSPPLSSEKVLKVLVKDANDNQPRFSQRAYDVYVLEHRNEAEHIFTLNATDEDDTHELHYALDSEGSRYLQIDESNGRLSTIRSVEFDRETKQQYTFIAKVVDSSGNRRFTATATINLHVRDQNDNDPRFLQSEYSFRKMENEEGFVGSLRATDVDSFADPFGHKVEYRFADDDASSQAARLFELRPTGEVHVRSRLDRENSAMYNFTVLAVDFSDQPDSRRTASTRVLVHVVDANDHAPRVSWPSMFSSNNTLRLSYRTARASAVARMLASDADEGVNARLNYAVVHTTLKRDEYSALPEALLDNTLLTVDERGTLKVGRELSSADVGHYVVTIKVSDSASGNQALSTSAKLYVTVDDSPAQQYSSDPLDDNGLDVPLSWDEKERRNDVHRSTRMPNTSNDQALLHLLITVMLAVVFLVLIAVCIGVIVRRVKAETKATRAATRRKQRSDSHEFDSAVDKFLAKLLCVTARRRDDADVSSENCTRKRLDKHQEAHREERDEEDDVDEQDECDGSPRSDDRTYATLDSTAMASKPLATSACRSLQRVATAKHDRQAVHMYDECANSAYLDYTVGTCHARQPNMLPPIAYCGSQTMCIPYQQYYSAYLPATQKTLQHYGAHVGQQDANSLAAMRMPGKEAVYVHKPVPLRAKSAAESNNSSCYDEADCSEVNNNGNARTRHEFVRHSALRSRRESVDGPDREIEQVLATTSASRAHTVVSCSPQRSSAGAASLHTQTHKQHAALVKGSYV